MHGVSRRTLLRDPKFGDLLLGGVARRIRCNGGSGTFGVKVVPVGLGRIIVEASDNLVRVDLAIDVSSIQILNEQRPY